jgi:hypothetical protein
MKTNIHKKRSINAKTLTLLHAIALVIGLFGAVAPSKAGSITAHDYLLGLYTWWQAGITSGNDAQHIYVRVTFQGGSATPKDGTGGSMAIFEGDVFGSRYDKGNAFSFIPLVASGSGIFYNVQGLSIAGSPLEGPYTVPFKLSFTYSQGQPALALQLDLRSYLSNGGIRTYFFNQITSDGGFPWGNWIGLNGGVGSAQGQATLVCSVTAQPHIH